MATRIESRTGATADGQSLAMPTAIIASELNRLEDPCRGNPPGVDPEAPRTPPRAAGTGGALMSGRLWLQDSKRAWRWDSSIYGVFSIKGDMEAHMHALVFA